MLTLSTVSCLEAGGMMPKAAGRRNAKVILRFVD